VVVDRPEGSVSMDGEELVAEPVGLSVEAAA
jgi:ATP-dependent Clp protease ATP-binding subunit ClpB